MIYTTPGLLQWLRHHCAYDRVIGTVLNTGRVLDVTEDATGWTVQVVSRNKVGYVLRIVKHSVTGDPYRWHRCITTPTPTS